MEWATAMVALWDPLRRASRGEADAQTIWVMIAGWNPAYPLQPTADSSIGWDESKRLCCEGKSALRPRWLAKCGSA